MSDLKHIDKIKFEKLFEMASGYVMDFSNRTFRDFILEVLNIDIYDEKYDYESGSKANLLRGFWKNGSNFQVAKLNNALFNYWYDIYLSNLSEKNVNIYQSDFDLFEECKKINSKLCDNSLNDHISAIQPDSSEQDITTLFESIRDSIEKNQPEAALDRLHTYLVKFVRKLCDKYSIVYDKDKPLHSLFGEYTKNLKAQKMIESAITERILKSSISIIDAFNDVRNNKSLAHDNALLNYPESMLIFKNISILVEFINDIEDKQDIEIQPNIEDDSDLPF